MSKPKFNVGDKVFIKSESIEIFSFRKFDFNKPYITSKIYELEKKDYPNNFLHTFFEYELLGERGIVVDEDNIIPYSDYTDFLKKEIEEISVDIEFFENLRDELNSELEKAK